MTALPLRRLVRARLGRHEAAAAEAYRAFFLDLDDLAAWLAELVAPARILEVGCGEGAVAGRLVRAFPEAGYVGIDISDRAGRLYDGPPGRARFLRTELASFLEGSPKPFDLVAVCDVVHHVCPRERARLLADAWRGVSPGGISS